MPEQETPAVVPEAAPAAEPAPEAKPQGMATIVEDTTPIDNFPAHDENLTS